MKTFLCEVVIVGQDFRQPFVAHHLHGDAVGEAVFLVGARLVQGQPLNKPRSRVSWRVPLVAANSLLTLAETRCLRSLIILSNVGG
jgi:hypothetical protein